MFLKSINVKGLLSFRETHLELRPLNVLIGPNASGKSNLIEVVALLQATPRDLVGFIRRSGGIADWLWKGEKTITNHADLGEIEVIFNNVGRMPLRYVLGIAERGQQFDIASERLENLTPIPPHSEPFYFYYVNNGYGRLSTRSQDEQEEDIPLRQNRPIYPDDITPGQSVLREIKGPTVYAEVNRVGKHFDDTRLYREWNLGRNSEIRKPQPTDLPNDFLDEDFSNLALVLNNLSQESTFQIIEEHLRRFYEMYERLGVNIDANTAQLRIREKGLSNAIPATRLSDGTLRFLAMLTILCHPKPPPLVCIEEPELGLHPDIISLIAELLKSASERTQLIVTTHSERLIDELSDDPESVVVCERDRESGTQFKRLSSEELQLWLEKYQLGELWKKGEIGGTRW